jgi:hypothetical protein
MNLVKLQGREISEMIKNGKGTGNLEIPLIF